MVDVGGVGFKLFIAETTFANLPKEGSKITLLCHLHVREDALQLYGFLSDIELSLFESLISVSGVGPKSAISIMGVTPADQLIAAIHEGKTELLSKASGVGKKTAERVVLELKGKLAPSGASRTLSLMQSDMDLEDALVGLGFTKQQAKVAISRIDPKIKDFNERLKAALKK